MHTHILTHTYTHTHTHAHIHTHTRARANLGAGRERQAQRVAHMLSATHLARLAPVQSPVRIQKAYMSELFDELDEHANERAAQGLVPTPLTPKQVSDLVEDLKVCG